MTVSDRRVARKGRARQRDQERAPIDPSALIVTRRLSKRYDSLIAVDHLDIEVRAGEIFGLLGQNGAGKTTTILMLLGLTEPSSGGARVAGFDPARNPIEVKRRVGYLPDAVGFYDGMTGRQNIRYTAKLNGLSGAEAEAKISEAIEHVGMTDRADSKVETYSRGMKQRLGIADALVKDPEILILDEPTTAIDPIGVIEILDMLRGLVRDRGIAVLLSSHLLQQVQSVCDRVGIFAAGKLIGVGTVAELADQFGEEAARIEIGFEALDPKDYPSTVKALEAIPGVSSVEAPSSVTEPFVVLTQPRDATASAREALIKTSIDRGLRLSSIREVAPSLDDIYRRALQATGLSGQRGAAA
ncbi:MAG TPA: ABC transporter ATP-binding protein [Candidatus Limnocylindrales bacterium]|nr:ABC transporter ATP-binding protein [Candidatus Limnocylindrales bacterium]